MLIGVRLLLFPVWHLYAKKPGQIIAILGCVIKDKRVKTKNMFLGVGES